MFKNLRSIIPDIFVGLGGKIELEEMRHAAHELRYTAS